MVLSKAHRTGVNSGAQTGPLLVTCLGTVTSTLCGDSGIICDQMFKGTTIRLIKQLILSYFPIFYKPTWPHSYISIIQYLYFNTCIDTPRQNLPLEMPTESTFPRLEIPNVDLWAFLFEREDKPYPDNKGGLLLPQPSTSIEC